MTRLGRAGALRRALATLLGQREAAGAGGPATPEHACQQTEAVRELHLVLARMKPRQRAVFVLFELEELSLEEIGAVVGAGVETVKSRLRHARVAFERLRRSAAWWPWGANLLAFYPGCDGNLRAVAAGAGVIGYQGSGDGRNVRVVLPAAFSRMPAAQRMVVLALLLTETDPVLKYAVPHLFPPE